MDNKNKLKDLGTVAGLTLVSRVLGLLRDIVIFAALGTSVYSSAFTLAFTLPNLFRRLLGEGAMTSAFMPILSDAMHGKDPKTSPTPRILNQVSTRLFFGLLGLAALFTLLFWGSSQLLELELRWALGARYATWLIPYMVLICMAAIFTSALNFKGYFGLSSLTPVWLNLSIIGCILVAGSVADLSRVESVTVLCVAVLLGGCFQMGSVLYGLRRSGWRLRADWGPSEELSRVWSLLIPGLLSGSILQINILLTRTFANAIDDSAASILYLASRLMELPLGVFAIAIATVLFPELAKAQSSQEARKFAYTFVQGIRWISVITIPSVVGLGIFRVEIVESLFKFGAFDAESVAATAPIVGLYALSIPAYAWISFLTRALHAQKKMRTTLWVSGLTLLLNGVLCYLGMQLGGILGLTLGNVAASWIQVGGLITVSRIPQLREALIQSQMHIEFWKILLASGAMAVSCWFAQAIVSSLSISDKMASVSTVIFGIPWAIAVYFGALFLLKQTDLVEAAIQARSKLSEFREK